MAKFTGTEPYQVPTNADLGSLAYQNVDGAFIQGIKVGQIQEVLNTKTSATGTVEHDFSTGSVWYHSSISANFTPNVTNVPTTYDNVLTVASILNQGGTGYYPSALQVNGSSVTIRWSDNTTPTPGTSVMDICVFTIFNVAGTFYAVGNYTTYA